VFAGNVILAESAIDHVISSRLLRAREVKIAKK